MNVRAAHEWNDRCHISIIVQGACQCYRFPIFSDCCHILPVCLIFLQTSDVKWDVYFFGAVAVGGLDMMLFRVILLLGKIRNGFSEAVTEYDKTILLNKTITSKSPYRMVGQIGLECLLVLLW